MTFAKGVFDITTRAVLCNAAGVSAMSIFAPQAPTVSGGASSSGSTSTPAAGTTPPSSTAEISRAPRAGR